MRILSAEMMMAQGLENAHQKSLNTLFVPQPEFTVSARRSEERFRELAEKGITMQYKKPQLHLIGNASKLIQGKGSDLIDVDIPGHAKSGLYSKLEEK